MLIKGPGTVVYHAKQGGWEPDGEDSDKYRIGEVRVPEEDLEKLRTASENYTSHNYMESTFSVECISGVIYLQIR